MRDDSGKAFCLARLDSDNAGSEGGRHLYLDDDALGFLRSIKSPVGVVAALGAHRTGKSSLLNRFLEHLGDDSKAFATADSAEPCTQGLWLCAALGRSRAAPRQHEINDWGPDRQEQGDYTLLLLDTEGADSPGEDENLLCQLMSLAVLMSSVVLYNQTSTINEHSIVRLAAVVELACIIRERARVGEGGEDVVDAGSGRLMLSGSCHDPLLLWVLRDCFLQPKQGQSFTEYMEAALAPSTKKGATAEEANRARSAVCKLFSKRQCWPLPTPTDYVSLGSADCLPLDELAPGFQRGLHDLLEHTLCSMNKAHHFPSGDFLADFLCSIVDALNRGGVPLVFNAWEAAVKLLVSKAVDEAVHVYSKELSAAESVEELQNMRHAGAASAEATYQEATRGCGEHASGSLDTLKERLEVAFGDMHARVREKDHQREMEKQKQSSRKSIEIGACLGVAGGAVGTAVIVEAVAFGAASTLIGAASCVAAPVAFGGLVAAGVLALKAHMDAK